MRIKWNSAISGSFDTSNGVSLPTHILKPSYLTDYIKPLTYLINKSFETGNFSDELKLLKLSQSSNLLIKH